MSDYYTVDKHRMRTISVMDIVSAKFDRTTNETTLMTKYGNTIIHKGNFFKNMHKMIWRNKNETTETSL